MKSKNKELKTMIQDLLRLIRVFSLPLWAWDQATKCNMFLRTVLK